MADEFEHVRTFIQEILRTRFQLPRVSLGEHGMSGWSVHIQFSRTSAARTGDFINIGGRISFRKDGLRIRLSVRTCPGFAA